MSDDTRLENTLRRIDQLNAGDPSLDAGQPAAKLYGQRMSEEMARYLPQAHELLQLAARAQHIQRWTIKRGDYPAGREGYRQWRTDLGRFHAEKTGELMRDAGYDEDEIARVGQLLRKERLKLDPDVQALEDVICLVFLRYYLDDFAGKHPNDKVVDILRKTWRKMSEAGRAAALTLPLSTATLGYVERALKED